MDKAATSGLQFRRPLVVETSAAVPRITDSYRDFAYGLYKWISWPFYMPVGLAPQCDCRSTTSRINETIDQSVFDRWSSDSSYRPRNLVEWAEKKSVDPAKLKRSVRADDPNIAAP